MGSRTPDQMWSATTMPDMPMSLVMTQGIIRPYALCQPVYGHNGVHETNNETLHSIVY